MGLETATYINGLNVSWPDGSVDPRSEGDDHIRLLKATLKNTFSGITGAVTSTHTELNYVGGVTSNIQTQIDNAVSAGDIKLTARATAPSGWLICNGSAVSRATYAGLFAAIGITYGGGDGSTTFNLPDGRDRVFIGASSTRALGSTGGSADAVSVAHSHTATSVDAGHTHDTVFYQSTGGGFAAASAIAANSIAITSASGAANISTTVNSSGVSGTNANMQPYVTGNWIIKT